MSRRLVVLLFALIVPFQLVWASAASYCEHETGVSRIDHFGHHAHAHKASAAKPAAHLNAEAASDCDICQAVSPAQLLQSAAVPGAAVVPLRRVSSPADAPPTSAPVRAPDRPQWSRLAS